MGQAKKIWDKPAVKSLSVKGLTLSGVKYAPNESVGSKEVSPSASGDPHGIS
jgi:hypothetical protein